ncbi:hypothetical protein BK120_33895 [Paenibacillus sp. FSL A5-0031]|uniref:hypothetical protein n=1 Tax=Paenibacillus sp. FSL A5-0031 TaxID=1920420 RepID=UPI000979DA6A|nr:hypothetical protein [Paenibacillus sp. FSL A5-0031]OME69177.1 hypothetical protein BK120_33895 [Paenibacillus sp. FSL A5-0031]
MSNQTAQIEKETGTKMVITIQEHGMPSIEEFSNGVSMGSGAYSHEAVVRAIMQSLEYNAIQTPILPKNAIMYFEGPMQRYCVMEIPAHKRTAFYHEAVLKGVPFPRIVMVFKLQLQKKELHIMDVYVGALASDAINIEDAAVYFYPYTNVKEDFSVCWGGQQLPIIERISQLSTFPDLFFNSPNSDCYYHSANNSKKTYRELVGLLKGKKFPDEYLKATGYTFQEWIKKFTSSI